MPAPIRTTIHMGSALRAFLDTGRVSGRSTSQRIDRLAQRYMALMHALCPKRWSLRDWETLMAAVDQVTLERPTDAPVIALRLRQMEKEGQDHRLDLSGVGYRFEQLPLPGQLAAIDVAERALAGGAGAGEPLRQWLEAHDVPVL